MSCSSLLNHFLFTHARKAASSDGGGARTDGRPLYAYRCTEQAYQQFKEQIGQDVSDAIAGRSPVGFEACFCIYAAETFRREHREGAWTWVTVFDPLGAEPPSGQIIVKWVEAGLQYWGREVITGSQGRRMALASIACEGGLPLKLLHKEGAHLRRFFHGMLKDHHERPGYISDFVTLAKHHIHVLPKTLRNEEVIQMAADLISRTVELQAIVGDAQDPIAALDEREATWRTTLPIRLEDEDAATLFQNLVEQSREFSLSAKQKPKWVGLLEEVSTDRFAVKKSVRLPSRLSGDAMSQLTGGDTKPRLTLTLNIGEKSEPIASLTKVMARGDQPESYKIEWLKRDYVHINGSAVTAPHVVVLQDNQKQHDLPMENSDEWGESPWVFLPGKDAKIWHWFAEGSAKARHDEVMVAVPDECLVGESSSGVKYVGHVPEVNRSIYHVTDSLRIYTPDDDQYQIRCNQSDDTNDIPQLRGPCLQKVISSRPVHRGMPRFHDVSGAFSREISTTKHQWRRIGDSGAWVSGKDGCVGRVWIRLVDSETGIERIRKSADVVPEDTNIERSIGHQNQAGYYQIAASGLISVKALNGNGVKVAPVKHSHERAEFVAECRSVSDGGMRPVLFELEWSKKRALKLELPYPQRGATFQLEGRPLNDGELVPLDRLYGTWLHVQKPAGPERFLLDMELVGGGTGIGPLGGKEQLPPLDQGELRVNLGLWADQIKYLLAAKDDAEARVRVAVLTQHSEMLSGIDVARYDAAITPVRESNCVQLPLEVVEKIGSDWHNRVSVSLVPLWEPSSSPRFLKMRDDAPGQWQIPGDLEPGPWWVIGRDGEWARFRPLLWTAEDQDQEGNEHTRDGLAGAVCEKQPDAREDAIDRVLSELGYQPDHPDWSLLQDYIQLATEFPPKTVDVLRQLIRHPRTLAMALFMADGLRFERVMSFADQMPFAWGLLPVEIWKESATRYYGHLRESLSGVDGGEEICWHQFQQFREQSVAARPYFESLCDWLQEHAFPHRTFENNSLKVARVLKKEFVVQQVSGALENLLERHDGDEIWPISTDILEIADSGLLREDFRFQAVGTIQRSVRCAPFVAAAIAIGGYEQYAQEARLIYQLRLTRGFDSAWFDEAYALGLTLGLARDHWEGAL